MKMPLIADIQKYSIHDGPGIRTTVFFKGCPLHCDWCHNPETQSYERALLWNPDTCTHCGNCVEHCPKKAAVLTEAGARTDVTRCDGCQSCREYCYAGARELSGMEIPVKELLAELKKDQMFYEESGGGVTLSGGEVMSMDLAYLLDLAKGIKEFGISLGIDSCGYAPTERFEAILPYVDFILFDVKIMNEEAHINYTGVSNHLILENLRGISGKTKIFLRIPVITPVNDHLENMQETLLFLQENHIIIEEVNLLPYHDMGKAKYIRLGQPYPGDHFTRPEDGQMEALAAVFREAGYRVTIG